MILVVPLIECTDESLLVHPCHGVDNVQKSLRRLDVSILRYIPAYRQHLVELSQLNRYGPQSICQPPHAVNDGAIYPEPLGTQPADALHIIGDCLVCDIFAPQDTSAQRIADHHQAEATSPISRIHLDGDLLILGYLLDMTHPRKVMVDCLFVYAIFQGRLFQSLLALDMIVYYLGLVMTDTAYKPPSAILAFIQLFPTFQAIADHICRPAKTFLPYR